MKDLDNIEVQEIHVRSRMGSRIDRAIRDAAVLAITEGHDVVLTFNDQTYRIDPGAIIDGLSTPVSEKKKKP